MSNIQAHNLTCPRSILSIRKCSVGYLSNASHQCEKPIIFHIYTGYKKTKKMNQSSYRMIFNLWKCQPESLNTSITCTIMIRGLSKIAPIGIEY